MFKTERVIFLLIKIEEAASLIKEIEIKAREMRASL
ncbi:hypothetical protein BJV85_001049 [Clostridium acetobutylicum]|nr:hypothetical protein [Clostridium acetobutylicum]NOW13573.1 hypothetical protein [Clostridium acetobutylicum]NRY55948.1 hypothetical protein [Clostridium acetobutylicum]NSA92203.1 hypothetical protein [Clostridium acetobutylicum]NYC93185.1 hypothetical protein [Clostridium acetobutylicum]